MLFILLLLVIVLLPFAVLSLIVIHLAVKDEHFKYLITNLIKLQISKNELKS